MDASGASVVVQWNELGVAEALVNVHGVLANNPRYQQQIEARRVICMSPGKAMDRGPIVMTKSARPACRSHHTLDDCLFECLQPPLPSTSPNRHTALRLVVVRRVVAALHPGQHD